MSKKILFFGGVIVIIVVILLGLYFFINRENICQKIDDGDLFERCELCVDSEDEVDCRDVVYKDFAFLKQDESLCDNLVQEFRKRDCLMNFEKIIGRGASVPKDESDDSGGFKVVR